MTRGRLDAVLARRRWAQTITFGVIGALAALGQAPYGVWPLTMLCVGLLFALLRRAKSAKQAFGIAWAAGIGYFAVALLWIVEPFLVDVARHGWMAPFALFGVSVGFGLFWAVTGWITYLMRGQALAFISVFVLAEALRGYALTGFPWAQLGHVLIDTPWLYWSSLGGSLALTGLVLIGAVSVTVLIESFVARAAGLAAALGALFASAGALTPDLPAAEGAPLIRMVHPSEPQEERWDPDKIPANFQRKLDFTSGGQDAAAPDLIVWPETSIPFLLERAQPALSAISDEAGDIPVVAGLQRFDGEDFYNSLIRINASGAVDAVYDKHHLVPFGEYVPFGDTLAKIGIFGLADTTGGGYAPGPGPQLIDFGDLGTALPLICYEAVFPQDVGGYASRPDFLLLITNDAWFGEASGPYQHLAQARLRSAEQGLPMIRVANTGVTAMIDATGRITHEMGLNETGWLDAPLPPARTITVYARSGDLPIVLILFALMTFLVQRARRISDRD